MWVGVVRLRLCLVERASSGEPILASRKVGDDSSLTTSL
jgi:hypothetical protein